MTITAVTAAQRPDLLDAGIPSREVWPEYNLHGDVIGRWWSSLYDELPDTQLLLVDDGTGQVVAEAQSGPIAWDGVDGHLPSGIDQALVDAVTARRQGRPVDSLCAFAAKVAPDARGIGLAAACLEAMTSLGRRLGLRHLVAPVRPSWKERYPLVPIERYASWTRDDGLAVDPWLRVHQRAGGRVAAAAPLSLRISGSVAEWENWTGMPFPETGDYVFPRGLATVRIDRESGSGVDHEPNVWVVHDLTP